MLVLLAATALRFAVLTPDGVPIADASARLFAPFAGAFSCETIDPDLSFGDARSDRNGRVHLDFRSVRDEGLNSALLVVCGSGRTPFAQIVSTASRAIPAVLLEDEARLEVRSSCRQASITIAIQTNAPAPYGRTIETTTESVALAGFPPGKASISMRCDPGLLSESTGFVEAILQAGSLAQVDIPLQRVAGDHVLRGRVLRPRKGWMRRLFTHESAAHAGVSVECPGGLFRYAKVDSRGLFAVAGLPSASCTVSASEGVPGTYTAIQARTVVVPPSRVTILLR